MTLYPFKIETHLNPDWLKANFNASLTIQGGNFIRQLINRIVKLGYDLNDIWGEAYISSSGRNTSVNYDGTTAEFDTDKYKTFNLSQPYVIIEAGSLTPSDLEINDCVCTELSSGKWLLYCDTGTDAVKRAQIYKTLFYGSNGSDARVTSTYITSMTALKTNISRDIGKRAHYATASTNASGESVHYVGTFSETTTNTDCSSWSVVIQSGTNNNSSATWELPNGTVLNTRDTNGTTDQTGTDQESDEYDNPTDCDLYVQGGSSASATGKTLILCEGDITWNPTEAGTPTYSNIDFFTDHSIPLLTEATDSEVSSIITHTIPSGTFNSTISSAFLTAIVEDYEDGINIQYKLTNATEDSGWLDYNEISAFTAFTSEPTTLIVKLVPKTTSPTSGYPSINGVAVVAR